jgi:uncharacterized protein (TIGR03435 family)
MTRPLKYLLCFAGACGAAFAQSADTPPRFEIADVHVSPKVRNAYRRGPAIHGGRYEIHTATMVDLVATAYGVKNATVLGGPSWLEQARFDVIANAPPKSKVADLQPQLQALLAERFKLVVHKDTQPVQGWAIVAGKRPTLKKTDPSNGGQAKTENSNANVSAGNGCEFAPPPPPTAGTPPIFVYKCRNITIAKLADTWNRLPGSFQITGELPVVDKTGLEGAFDFELRYSLRNGPPAAAGAQVTYLQEAIEQQLGLKLEPSKTPMPVLVVDSVNDTPSPNEPGAVESLHVPPPPKEFEVGEIKLTNPDFKGGRFQILPGGRVNIQGLPLKAIIEQTWDIRDEMLIGWPKGMDQTRFDLVAKVSVEPDSDNFVDYETVLPLIKALIQERFKLAVHTEERQLDAYTLTAVKPKIRKADPNSRTRFTEGPGPDGKDPRIANPEIGRLVTIQNMTMAQICEQLQDMAGGYIHSPVLDKTGLEGGYDFTLSFSPIQVIRPGGGGGRGGDAPSTGLNGSGPSASDPTGGITLFDAVEKQLGLKLVPQKRQIEVLVIDHIEPKPTDN